MRVKEYRKQAEISSDSLDPEFLTFRYNSPNMVEGSGRSIYSQRHDYRSLQKYPLFDEMDSEHGDLAPSYSKKNKEFKERGAPNKQKKLRSARSQDKFPITHTHQDPVQDQEEQQKNEELKQTLSKLVRNIKKEQRKEINLDKDLQDLGSELKELDQELHQQQSSIGELGGISEDNMRECNRIIQSIQDIASRNDEMAARLEEIEDRLDSSEISVETNKQDSTRDRALFVKLKEGLGRLGNLREKADGRLQRLEEQIANMQRQIAEACSLQFQIGESLSGWSLNLEESQEVHSTPSSKF